MMIDEIIARVEEALVRDSALAEFFEDANNIYPTIRLVYDKGDNAFDITFRIETDGTPLSEDEIQEQVNDKIMDDYLFRELEHLSTDLDSASFDISVEIVELEE